MKDQLREVNFIYVFGMLGSVLTAVLCVFVCLINGDEYFLLVACGFLVFCFFLILLREAGTEDLLNPLHFVLLTFFGGVVARALYLGIIDDEKIIRHLMLGGHLTDLSLGMALTSMGVLFAFLGYFTTNWLKIPFGKIAFLKADVWSSRRLFFVVCFFCAIAAVSTALFVQKMGLTGILLENLSAKRRLVVYGAEYKFAALGYYRWGASFFAYAFFLYFAFFLSELPKKKLFHVILLVVLFLFASFFPVLVSSRASLLSMIIVALVFYHYFKKPLSLKYVSILLLLFAFIVFSMGALRAVAHKQAQSYSAFYGIDKVAEAILANRNYLDITKTSHIANTFPSKEPLQFGRTMIGWLFAPVPREVWKEKPMVRPGPFVAKVVYADRNLKTGTPPGLVGEVILNFGVWSVPLLMYLFGVILGLLYKNFVPLARCHKNAALLYGFIVFAFAFELLGGDVSGVFQGLLMDMVPMIGAVSFISHSSA